MHYPLTAETFAALWGDRHGTDKNAPDSPNSPDTPDSSDTADFWNRRAPSFNAHMREKPSRQRRRDLVQHLLQKTGVRPSATVLDIGCGSGAHALELAPLTHWVEGLDIAPAMIDLARENALQDGCRNVNFRVLDWADANLSVLGWQKAFDLVLAIRTPALRSAAALAKMQAASRQACGIITHVQMRHSVRDALQKYVHWDAARMRMTNGFYCAFNILWLEGRYPEVEYLDQAWERTYPLEEARRMHLHYFESSAPLTVEQRHNLEQALEDMSVDGTIHEKVQTKLAVMLWRTEE